MSKLKISVTEAFNTGLLQGNVESLEYIKNILQEIDKNQIDKDLFIQIFIDQRLDLHKKLLERLQ
jgi:hypothetical protein